jgi:hypothetical protein
VLTIKDLMWLLNLSEQMASKIMRQIKFKHDRLHISGKLHIEDYFAYFGITNREFYIKGIAQ